MRFVFLLLLNTETNRDLLDYQYVDHRIDIVSHERDYSNVDVYEQAIVIYFFFFWKLGKN